LLKY
ncbi:cytosol aminopeptidase, partial [Vibrio parahaemolyticus V-223/04]|jgi:hypothetical protein